MDERISKVISEYKRRTKRECSFIECTDEVPSILDDKIGGKPYLPINEEYPKDNYGNPMALFMQVNLTNLNLEGYPKGILELFVTTKEDDFYGFSIPEGTFKMKLFDEGLEYQAELPDVKLKPFLVNGPFKIKFNKGTMTYPYNMGDDDAVNILLDLFEDEFNVSLETPGDLEREFNVDYYDLQDELYDSSNSDSHVGAYASFINDPDVDYYDKPVCLLFIGSDIDNKFDLGNANSFYVLMSEQDLANKDFSNVTCNFEWS